MLRDTIHLCGDNLNVFLNINEQGIIEDISFQGSGCAISKASASLMTSMLKGKSVEEAEKIFNKFHELVTDKLGDNPDIDEFGKLAVFGGVREFPGKS